ncbi:MAG: hypothetical protein FJW37_15745 [Acidobacteria bacterium]|nr:hypothetical protein [Acidobacteriota bacterium]
METNDTIPANGVPTTVGLSEADLERLTAPGAAVEVVEAASATPAETPVAATGGGSASIGEMLAAKPPVPRPARTDGRKEGGNRQHDPRRGDQRSLREKVAELPVAQGQAPKLHGAHARGAEELAKVEAPDLAERAKAQAVLAKLRLMKAVNSLIAAGQSQAAKELLTEFTRLQLKDRHMAAQMLDLLALA